MLDAAELEKITAELQRPQSLSGAHALWNRVTALGASEARQLVAHLGWLRVGGPADPDHKAAQEAA